MKIHALTLILLLIAFTSISSQNFWEKTNGLDNQIIWSLAINSGGNIFAGNGTDGVYRSTDKGVSWSNIGPNLGSYNYTVRAMLITPVGDIIVGISDDFANGGMYRSTDNGNNWSEFGIPEHPVLALAQKSNGYLFAGTHNVGVYRSTNDGANWEQINQGLSPYPACRSLVINSTGNIFLGTLQEGIFRSINDGDNWAQMNQGLTNSDVRSLASNSTGHIFAGTYGGGIFRSMDEGANWEQINQGFVNGQSFYCFSLAINSDGHIFAGTADGVYQSTDNGGNWNKVSSGLINDDVQSLAINSNDDVFAGTYDGVFRTNPSANIKVFLQGPYSSSTSTMSTTLNTNGYIPLTQPYSAAPWNYAGTEEVASIPVDVVDWVLLELRSDETTVESRRAAFLLSDGSVVDLDGESNVRFPGVVPGDYYVVIRHRNHLAVMTANPVTLSFSPVLYHFRTALSQAYGTSAMKDLGGGFYGLFASDANGEGTINATDLNGYWILQNGTPYDYQTKVADFNLDATINATDLNTYWIPNNGKATQVP